MIYKDFASEDLLKTPNTLNSLSPYIGRLRPECAGYLIQTYADPQKPVFDPFCGSGTILLQGWINGFDVYGNDLSPYAYVLSLGKLYPYSNEEHALDALTKFRHIAEKNAKSIDLDSIPGWVREFYNDTTLKEIIAWEQILKRNKEWFLLSCLLGILHHQRPGFLSYPASHGAPYLRCNKYPRDEYPEMYTYKNVFEKLSHKVCRVYKNFPDLDYEKQRIVTNKNACTMHLSKLPSGTIITSPPYMRSLTYARDNRLRLWLLGEENWEDLDNKISPHESDFKDMMISCFRKWSNYQASGDKCIIVIGDLQINHNEKKKNLAQFITDVSSKNYILLDAYQDPIPEKNKLVKGNDRIKREFIVALERK